MIVKGNQYICRVSELAEMISKRIVSEHPKATDFRTIDFAVIDDESCENDTGSDFDCIRSGVTGWYGIKEIDPGFDGEDLYLCADYYGGGCTRFETIFVGLEFGEIKATILSMLNSTLEYMTGSHDNVLLFAETKYEDCASEIVIEVEDGMVTDVWSSGASFTWSVVDHDCDDEERKEEIESEMQEVREKYRRL